VIARLLVGLVCWMVVVSPASADLGGYVIRDFHVELEVRPDASLIVSERLEVDFSEPRHGIYRTIPVRYTDPRGYDYSLGLRLIEVSDDTGKPYPTRVSHPGRFVKIRIGNPKFKVRGRVVYALRYRVADALVHFAEHDELYWNATGTQWKTRIERASTTVRLPGEVVDEDLQVVGYTGRYGSREQTVSISRLGPGAVSFTATRPLDSLEGLTIAVGWPHGLVEFPGVLVRSWRFFSNNWVLLAPLAALGFLWRAYRRKGRDPQGPESVVVRYEPPEELRPAELGTVVDEKVDLRDITATIVDLAVRGYIRIEVAEQEQLFGLLNKEQIVFHRLTDRSAQELLPFEQRLIGGLFAAGADRVEVDDLERKFYKEVPKIQQLLYERLTATGHFAGNPSKVRKRYSLYGTLVGGAVFGAGFLWAQARDAVMPNALIVPAVAALATAVLWLVFARAMPRRTRKGVRARGWAMGFEEFVDRVESEKLEADRRRNVFESLLPYAMALGVASGWARRFEGIYDTSGSGPAWYVGARPPTSGFSTAGLERSLNTAMSKAGRSMTAAPRSSSSSGFGGGGGSGGGGGGGGGGSW
jgi:hypothetical protein